MKKRVIYLIIILLVGVIGGECYIYFTKVFDNTSKDNNLEISKNPLDYGYLKTVNNNNFFREEAFVKDTKRILDEKEIETEKELIKEYTVNINGNIKKLIATYSVNNLEILYTLKWDGKIVESYPYYLTYLNEETDKAYTISDFKKLYSDCIFDAKYLLFFKGNDNKDYIFLFDFEFDEWESDILGYIYNDEFEKLAVNIDGEQKDTWTVWTSVVEFTNLEIYRKSFGYRTKMNTINYEKDTNFLINLVDGKLRFLKIISGEKNVRKFREYELIINNNQMDVKDICDYNVYFNTSVTF